ncbi:MULTISPECIES: 3-deoxy-7-phosphoheptulonate synthase [unclassified Shewanella]|uniref:3-deoxy-7-phosphoheptulonate synthase n=1 Tax=unclassified Shewanella TaxID=196818 RepID=UPI00097064C2|nr:MULTISPECIES: 3-deoxy-7-phosphoheptulonate synthase [unclassified Shewanella]MDO6617511.1 3-deoxy-7-phosphoheptulonate synthase [Shewanella sp. 6_MG-2023]MDO6638758.1 3-deoxy-7-phosphoheptulonate synthase [Shewanella sp. 5_MG-2023]MDO6677113.1 3-deoxy-7-phosphoheptulonate synthase [Shewanella sp. 4_MG-2023]MDO6773776.1 3-deoxy-7-phosphoheptulonate synthase [Shewanella sp. 3_MG-2023]PMG43171.1 3-deoxy-7-phosphoheptulonate synthase [Shewanella sp. 10N.286.52.B9]
MQQDTINNVHISSEKVLVTPAELKKALPLSDHAYQYILDARKTVADIVHKRDNRVLIVTGPCSIHDIDAAKEYALKLKKLHDDLSDEFYILMRVYFEKPRTTVGWKGLINDPDMDESFDVEKGLRMARELMIWLAELELPVATEALDPISPQYMSELVTWSAIGARTTESQTHREMASGLSMPVGFKNGTDGKLGVAINALQSAASSHRFMGINQQGQVSLLQTAGNPDGHVILRGGKTPNYDADSVAECEAQLHQAKLNARLIIDCSHGNSSKDYTRQTLVCEDVFKQIHAGNRSIIGVMLESHLNEGNQSSNKPLSELAYGVSVTDSCINWQTTETLLRSNANLLKTVLPNRFAA